MPKLTYCTNVHPLNNFEEWIQKIGFFGPKIRDLLGKDTFSLGLWFNQNLVRELFNDNFSKLKTIRDLFEKESLSVFTLNGFPFGNFHSDIVKKSVYLPAWYEQKRLNYTLDCARLLAELLESDHGSISTLPLGWREDWTADHFQKSAEQLLACVLKLIKIRADTGKKIQLCLEPEPGCILENTTQVIDFWNDWLRPCADAQKLEQSLLNDHLGVCYDTCHQAVQFENPVEVLNALSHASIPIGKIQLSNALEFKPDPEQKSMTERKNFAEKKFLHQTRIKKPGAIFKWDDLPEALESQKDDWNYPWRVHFHLPLFAQDVINSDIITTTVNDMQTAYQYALSKNICQHFEVETYTWSVLPAGLKPESDEALAEGIAREIRYVEQIS